MGNPLTRGRLIGHPMIRHELILDGLGKPKQYPNQQF